MPKTNKEFLICLLVTWVSSILYFYAEYKILGLNSLLEMRETYALERNVFLVALGVILFCSASFIVRVVKNKRKS